MKNKKKDSLDESKNSANLDESIALDEGARTDSEQSTSINDTKALKALSKTSELIEHSELETLKELEGMEILEGVKELVEELGIDALKEELGSLEDLKRADEILARLKLPRSTLATLTSSSALEGLESLDELAELAIDLKEIDRLDRLEGAGLKGFEELSDLSALVEIDDELDTFIEVEEAKDVVISNEIASRCCSMLEDLEELGSAYGIDSSHAIASLKGEGLIAKGASADVIDGLEEIEGAASKKTYKAKLASDLSTLEDLEELDDLETYIEVEEESTIEMLDALEAATLELVDELDDSEFCRYYDLPSLMKLVGIKVAPPSSEQREDLAHIWHPCSQMSDYDLLPPLVIKRAKGMYLYDTDNKAYMDCVSSWWVNLFGHCNPTISRALAKQSRELDHIIFANYTHKQAIALASRITALLKDPLDRVFFADNGSAAIEAALKMAYHYRYINANKPQNSHDARTSSLPKHPKYLSLKNSYHGETIGALSLGDLGLYKDVYSDILIDNVQVEPPLINEYHIDKATSDARSKPEVMIAYRVFSALDELERMLDEQGGDIIAFIIEPLLQCAGAMSMYPASYLEGAITLCHQYGVIVIFDEIATGFGRTGRMFALDYIEGVPDMVCLSKGLTAGYLPMSMVVTSSEIYSAFLAPYEDVTKAFLHSHSYTGNALAMACANACLDIFEARDILKDINIKGAYMEKYATKRLYKKPYVKNLRRLGMVLAYDLEYGVSGRIGVITSILMREKGFLIRPLGNTIYLMPPYIITKKQIREVIDALALVGDRLEALL